MKTIIFIGSYRSGSSREAIRVAERLGYYTVLFTNQSKFIKERTKFPDVHLIQLCNLNNIEEIKNKIKHLLLGEIEISAIVSFRDPYCYIASLLAEEFGVNRFSTEAIGIMQNKISSRQVLSQSPYGSYFKVLSKNSTLTESEIEKQLPLIMKSPNSTGSKDVFKIKTYEDFEFYKKKLLKKYPNEPILIEEFLDGPQYHVEVIVYKQKTHIIGILEQEITYNKRFIITGNNLIIDPPENFYENLKVAVKSIVRSHELESGPCHMEMRYVKNQWKLVEINPRNTGTSKKMFEIGFGINLIEETLKFALGQEPNLKPRHKEHVFTQYVIVSKKGILKKVIGENKASKCPGVKEVYVRPRKGTLLKPPLGLRHRYAYVIATGDSEQEAKENAKHAASQIHFWVTAKKKQRAMSGKNKEN